MTNILCINTAFSKADIALKKDGQNSFKSLNASAKTSENVLPAIENILTANNLSPKELDVFSVVVGTGSFTGLRIGVAIVKGMAVANKKMKIVALNSLTLMARKFLKENANFDKDFYCIQNALSGRFFVSKFNANGDILEKAKLVFELPQKTVFVGLESEGLDFVNFVVELDGKVLLEESEREIADKNFVALEKLEPLYLRLSQAEENLLKISD